MPETLRRKIGKIAEAVFPGPLNLWRKRRYLRSMARREKFWQQQGRHGQMVHDLQPGVRMHLYFDSELCRYIYVKDFESEERKFMNLFLRPDDVFVDVGANVGLFTVIAAHLVGSRGRVYAFEPCRSTFARLQENVGLNGFNNAHCERAALSDASGDLEMVVSAEGLDGWNSFARPYVGNDFSREKVKTTTWDEYALTHGLTGRVALMKIDVEGWEEKVLRGMERELAGANAPVIQIEFTDAAAQAAGLSCEAVYRHLRRMGYEVCRFEPDSARLVAEELRPSYPYCNLFAVKNRTAVQARLDASAARADS